VVEGIHLAERWVGSCRRELLRTLIWDQRHLMSVQREYEDFCSTHRPHRTLNRPRRCAPLHGGVTSLDHSRVRRRDGAEGVIHECRLWHGLSAPAVSRGCHPATGEACRARAACAIERAEDLANLRIFH